jgi:predicted Zn-dependent protease
VSARAARVAVALVAVAVLAWLGVMERDARLLAQGVDAAKPPRAPGALERADAAFGRAALLNPDTAPDVSRAFVLQARGREDAAIAVLEDVVRREPENLGAWRVLLTITRDARPVIGRRARAAVRELDPVNAPPR